MKRHRRASRGKSSPPKPEAKVVLEETPIPIPVPGESKDRVTVVWNLYKDESDWQRHNEVQRGNLTNVILAVCAALVSFTPKEGQEARMGWPVAALITALGMVGTLAVFKYWERFNYHTQLLRSYRTQLDALVAGVVRTREAGKQVHETTRRGPFNDRYFKQYWLWLAVHLVVTAFGAIQLAAALRR